MTVTITGATGFLGSAMARHLRQLGHEVRDTGRLRLGEPAPPETFAGSDCVIHGAHDFASDAFERNRAGTESWFRAAREAGVRRQIFLGSFSARADSPSLYGRTKFTIERTFLEGGETVVRPGLVAGPGGMFAKFTRQLGAWRVAPLVSADSRSIAVVALEDFLSSLARILERDACGAFNLFAPGLLTGREFAAAVWKGLGTRGLVLEIPAPLAISVLRLVAAHGPLDSLRGQLANAVPAHRSDLHELVPDALTAARAVELAARR